MADSDKKRDRIPRLGRNKNDNSKEPGTWKGPGKSLIFWLGLFLVIFVIYTYYTSFNQDMTEINYTEFVAEIDNANVLEVTFTESEIEGKLREAKAFASTNSSKQFAKFKSRVPEAANTYDLIKRLEEKDVKIIAKVHGPDFFSVLISIAPWIFLVLIWLFFLRQMQGAGGQKGLFSFGKSKAKLLTDERPKVTFNDVAGAEEAKEELQEIIEFLKEPVSYTHLTLPTN